MFENNGVYDRIKITNLKVGNRMVDYKKIKLADERSTHVQKRLNRNGGWKFFKILYRDSAGRIFMLNILMLLFAAPLFLALYFFVWAKTAELTGSLPVGNFLGMAPSVWLGVGQYQAEQTALINSNGNLWVALAMLLFAFAFSGGFAVIRDSYWTGKLKVWKPFWKGVASTIGYTLPGTAVLAGAYLGITFFSAAIQPLVANWVFIIIMIAVWVLFALIFMLAYTLFAVASTYKQPVADNFADAWRLVWLNFLPNILRVIVTALPFGLYFLLVKVNGGILTTLLLAAGLMLGMFYIVYVYMVHMMRTFALFHPVEPKQK